MATGCSCDDPELVAVNDRNMAPVYVSGNPYSRYCTNCGRRYFCADTFWENSDDKHVIPNGEDEPVPFDEYEAENVFECPADGCGTVHFGYPDQCDACGQTYKWEDN